MDGFSWIATIVIGGIAGWIGSMIMHSRNGMVVNIILGVLGASVAGWLLGVIGFSAEPRLIPQMMVAVAGAVILIWVARKLRG